MTHQSAYATRARLGLIVPPTNTVNEQEWQRMMPEGVSFHTHRMRLHGPGEQEALMRDLDAAVAMLAEVNPDAIAYACTAGSMTIPANAMPEAVSARTGKRVLTTSASLIAALKALGADRISVATPYTDTVNAHEVDFLKAHGMDVAAIEGLGIGAGGPAEFVRIARTSLAEVEAHARKVFVPGSDALLIACTDFPTLPLIERLEADLGVPVVTSNQATLWAMLRQAGIADSVEGGGTLFSRA